MRRAIAWSGLMLAGCLGGPVEQTPGCAAYVACMRALDATTASTTNLDRFVPGGACWVNGETGAGCATGCERALDRTRARSTGLPAECAP
jgi:hypothetical protein